MTGRDGTPTHQTCHPTEAITKRFAPSHYDGFQSLRARFLHPEHGNQNGADAPMNKLRHTLIGASLGIAVAVQGCTGAIGDVQHEPRGGQTPLAAGTSAPGDQAPPGVTGAAAASGAVWRPVPGLSWQWQLTGTIDLNVDAKMFDIDLFDTAPSTIADLHLRGSKVICYVSAGSFEDWRPDAALFPPEVKGNALAGWPGEAWLDVRRIDLLGPILDARMDLCRSKGFDGIELDNVDGYNNNTGFSLTATDQLQYNRYLAGAAHTRGLSVGLKNDLDQVTALVSLFDWALNEACFQFQECNLLAPFVQAGKAVFNVEYSLPPSTVCPQAKALDFSTLIKDVDLDARRQACP